MATKKEDLLKVFIYQAKDFNGMISNILETSLITRINRTTFIETNARFIYLLGLFERFIGNLNKYLIKTNKPIKRKYNEMFESLCDEQRKLLKSDREWKSYYNRPTKMINDYSILEKKKNGLVILRSILKDSVDLKEKGIADALKYYYEARARRNLIAHRGRAPDKIYFDDLKQNNIDEKFQKNIFKRSYLYKYSTSMAKDETLESSLERKENNKENLQDLSITPAYLHHVSQSIIYITNSLLMDIKDKELDIDIHEFIKQGIKNKDIRLLQTCYGIFARKIVLHHDGQIQKLSIDHKVNFLLLWEYLNKEKISKIKLNHQKIIDSISEDEHFSAKYIKNLLSDYFKKDKKSFYKNTKKLINKFKDQKFHFSTWLIFQRYMRYKEFRDLFKKDKKEIKRI